MAKAGPAAHAQFTASIPENYDHYLGPVLFEPYAKDLAERLRKSAPKRVLETACGTGIVTRFLLDSIPKDATLTATDLNAAMVDYARSKVSEDPRLRWKVADMCALDFEDGEFDVVVCQFGVMFAPDKDAAFREARRVLGKGARCFFNVWDEIGKNKFARITNDTIRSFFPKDPPTFYQTPFGFYDRAVIKQKLESAGFSRIHETVVMKASESRNAREFARGLIEGNPVFNEIQSRGAATHEVIEAELATRMIKHLGDRPVRVRLQAIVFEATA